jgi:superfamily II DNA/RNA helicase
MLCPQVGLDQLAALVLDEADRMLEIGFKEQVPQICTTLQCSLWDS